MGAWLGRMPRSLAVIICFAGVGVSAAAPPSEEQILAWVRDLDAESFNARQAATSGLTAAREQARDALTQTAQNGNPEAAWRAAAILEPNNDSEPIEPIQPVPSLKMASISDSPNEPTASDAALNPEPPPATDIADALAPPPEPVPLEDVTEFVLIADAYVSPELGAAPSGPATQVAATPVAAVPDSASVSTRLPLLPTTAALLASPSRSLRTVPTAMLLRQPASRFPSTAVRDSQPRVMNFFQRARTALGLSVR